jgi:hypothetical protein
MAQARQTMSSTSDLLRRVNRARAALLLVNSNTELVLVLHVTLQLRSVWLPFSEQAYRVFRTPVLYPRRSTRSGFEVIDPLPVALPMELALRSCLQPAVSQTPPAALSGFVR